MDLVQKVFEQTPFGIIIEFGNFLGVGGIERNPEKQEGAVVVTGRIFGPLQPAERTVDS